MAIKATLLGYLIYAAMAAWLAAFGVYLRKNRRLGDILFGAGCAVMVGAVCVRWVEVEHAPLQNLFEVFTVLGALMFPLWLFCRSVLGASGPAANVLIGVVLLFPAGFVFHAEPQRLPPALQSWLFVPHVASYMAAYVVLGMAAVQAGLHLANGEKSCETATYRMILFGYPLLTLGLILGAVWGKIAWGDYWNWDPKELWSLATWLVYSVYLHFRAMYGSRFARANSVMAIAGAVAVVLTLLWVNLADKLFPGMHVYTQS